jgi:transglutaminase superfamily protein/coenzyme PQQ synthesis protein D (PqqD)
MRRGPGFPGGAWSEREVITSMDSRGEIILLHIPSGTYLGLDSTAARIVELLNENPDPSRAASALSEQFEIPYAQAFGDIEEVLDSVNGMAASRIGRGRRPTIAGVRQVTRSWWRQTWRYRLVTVQVTAVVVIIEIGLRCTNVSRLARWMCIPLATHEALPPDPAPDDLSDLTDREKRAYWAVNWVMTRWLYDGTCLRRALAYGWFLRRRHPVLRLGMIDESAAVAHAWIEVEGRTFNSQPVTGAFASKATQQ